jgi:methionine-rich copper-binding protein CopC
MNNFMKIILGIGLMVMFLMIRIPVAIAHTNLIDSTPAPGEVLDQSPSEVRLISGN